MNRVIAALGVGALFGAGLGVAGMTRADKVIGFLDLANDWDPSLALVMVGAIGVHLVAYRWILRRPSPLLGTGFAIPTRTDLDGRLIGGAALFGVGWALGGYCPGPGLVSLSSGSANALVFVVAMTAGMALFRGVERLATRQEPAPEPSSPRHA